MLWFESMELYEVHARQKAHLAQTMFNVSPVARITSEILISQLLVNKDFLIIQMSCSRFSVNNDIKYV